MSERTPSIHSIPTRRRETFDWATALATIGFGYLGPIALFAAAICVPP
ncbi:hypothetical protein ACIP2Y_43945 [Streptomyces sviceus]